MNGLRKFFGILSIFDWITPTAAMLENLDHGGPLNSDVWTFYVPYDHAISKGWSSVHIENLLARRGIRTWGGLVHFGEYFFKVDLAQAAWAEYILTSYGVPIQKKSQGAPPRPKKKQSVSTILDSIFEAFK